jgi:hypothetical protein
VSRPTRQEPDVSGTAALVPARLSIEVGSLDLGLSIPSLGAARLLPELGDRRRQSLVLAPRLLELRPRACAAPTGSGYRLWRWN